MPKARVWASLDSVEAIGQEWYFAQPRPIAHKDRKIIT